MASKRVQFQTLTRRRWSRIHRLSALHPSAPGRHALLIGTTRYRHRPFSRLNAAAGELRELHALLTSPQLGGFEAPAPLLDQPACQLNMELEGFFRNRAPDDVLVLYVSGHALMGDGGAVSLATTSSDRSRWRSTAIDLAFLCDLMDQCGSRSQALFLDCRFGSSSLEAAPVGAFVDIQQAVGGPRRVVLSASNATQFAFRSGTVVGDPTPSRWTARLVQGLRTGEADRDGDGRVTTTDLAVYTRAAWGAEGAAGSEIVIARNAALVDRLAGEQRARPLSLASPEATAASGPRHHRANWAIHAASSVASWLAHHVGR